MRKIIILSVFLFISVCIIQAQELNATVTVNSDRISGTNKNVFQTLERALYQFINGERWSSTTFSFNERIDCTFSVTVLEYTPESGDFKAELFVQARRPVYNSSYITPLLNFRDTNVEFKYTENAPLEITQSLTDNNLVAIVMYYCNMILALDFDSFSPLGGGVFYREAQARAVDMQTTGFAGWSAFNDNKSRTAIANVYLNESVRPFREFWYNYHRKGLDEMAANPDRARTTILNSLSVLKDIRGVRDAETLLQMFADCKLDEIVAIASKATAEEKKSTYDLLRSIYPAMSTQLEPLKN